MWSELLLAIRGGVDQVRYFRHTYLPLSPWRHQTDAIVAATTREAERYGLAADVDRRRAYQLARMNVANRKGEHLASAVPDAYMAFSPPSAATFHAGRRSYPAPAERLDALRTHPQMLAYLLTPGGLARRGVGASPPGGLGAMAAGEALQAKEISDRLRERVAGIAPEAAAEWAATLVALQAGPAPEPETAEPAASEPEEQSDAA